MRARGVRTAKKVLRGCDLGREGGAGGGNRSRGVGEHFFAADRRAKEKSDLYQEKKNLFFLLLFFPSLPRLSPTRYVHVVLPHDDALPVAELARLLKVHVAWRARLGPRVKPAFAGASWAHLLSLRTNSCCCRCCCLGVCLRRLLLRIPWHATNLDWRYPPCCWRVSRRTRLRVALLRRRVLPWLRRISVEGEKTPSKWLMTHTIMKLSWNY